jgi:hypothetical protein
VWGAATLGAGYFWGQALKDGGRLAIDGVVDGDPQKVLQGAVKLGETALEITDAPQRIADALTSDGDGAEPHARATNAGPKNGRAGGEGAGKAFPNSVKERARAESGGKCVFCGKATSNEPGPTRSEVDHAVPKSKGGDNTIDNAQNTCRTCNRQKGSRTSEEFLEGR